MALNAGDEVDRYRIVALLGAGGMGEVYHAFDTRLHRNVALKLLHPPKDGEVDSRGSQGTNPSSSRGSARMLREARAAAQLEHPNVVNVYDVGELTTPAELEGTAFLAMELIKGKPLRAFLRAPVAMRERIRWMADIARALSAAHAQGVVHRDIKPENVMLRHDGVVKVLDFGIAKRSGFGQVDPSLPTEEPQIVPTLTTKGVAIGTPYYMAPEQMRGDALDGRADQFSWGVMAYELLVGRGPWRTDTDALGLVSQVLSKPVDFPREHNAEIPMHIAYVIVRALSKAREDRFPSMEAVLDAMKLGSAESVPPAKRDEPPSAPPTRQSDAGALGNADTEAIGTTSRERAAPEVPTTAKNLGRAPPPHPRSRTRYLVGAAAVLAVAAGAYAIARVAKTAAPLPIAASSALPVAQAPGCTTSAACVASHEGKPFHCRREDGVCVPLASEDCAVHAQPGEIENDETVWIGTLFGASDFNQRGVELGRRDFAAVPRLLPGAGSTVPRRPIAVIACDDQADAARAAQHLVDEVKVPAVIGFSKSQEAIDLLTGELVPHGMLTMVSTNTTSLITSIHTPEGKPRLILRTTNTTLQLAQALGTFLADVIEPRLHAERKHPLRIAVVRPPNPGGLGFSDAIVSTLRFNGASVAENPATFNEYVLSESVAPADPAAVEARRGLLASAVDVVFYYGSEAHAQILAPLEAVWPAARPRPVYLSALPLDELGELAKTPLQKRLYGVTTPSNTSINTKFVLHYNATFPEKVTPTVSPATTYDAFYVLAYASYAVGSGAMTGESLAAATRKLVGGEQKVEVGPARILEALGVLGAGAPIDLAGAGSALDFDPVTGESPSDHVILCVGVGASGVPQGVESGLVWDAKTGKLRGTLKCP